MTAASRTTGTVGLALAGGGPEGAIYEIGALRALDEALEGVDFNNIPIYVGVSSGAFIASCVANNLTTAQMCRAIVKHEPGEHPSLPQSFVAPAVGELLRSSTRLPRIIADALWDYVSHLSDRKLLDSVTRLGRALPVGIFDGRPLRTYLEKIFALPGRTNDFRRLPSTFIVVATDLDSGRQVRFGEPGLDHVPIATAVQASTALPGLYPPVEIGGRHYVDGVLLKTVHASVAFDLGADLVLCVNPIVPVDTVRSVESGVMRRGKLSDRGLPTVLSQTFRTIIHSRMGVGIASYESRYAGRDILVFEPRRDDYDMFFSNVFSFANRKAVCEHAYQATLDQLRRNRRAVERTLARHGIRLRAEVLEDEDRNLWETVDLHKRRPQSRSPLKVQLDRVLEKVEKVVREYDNE